MELHNIGPGQLDAAAAAILKEARTRRIWAFYGEMGSGKTTLIKAICRRLGVREEGSSPTFSLVNEYKTGNGELIYHFDFYRINRKEEVFDIGYEDYFYSGHICLLEWPELIGDLLEGEDVYRIRIKISDNNKRDIQVDI